MMKYIEFLKPAEGFQYSINLQYDLGSNNKVKGYIPTISTLDILKDYLKKIYYGKGESSTVLIGPYGKGKSHLLLILLTLLEQKEENKEALNDLILNIERIDVETAQLARVILDEEIKLLPVIINGSHINIQQAFLLALSDALKKNNIDDIKPNTYFESVLDIIQNWKANYKDTIEVLKSELLKDGIRLDELENGLKNYNGDAFQAFKKAYLAVSSGIEYNPMVNSDVVRLYDETNFLLCEKYGYKGMFVVFDEFSKFMEASVTNDTAKDLKILQDFAELASRSNNKQQLNFACITHKTINEYISKLPKQVINSWRAIEGRFKEIYLTSSSKQNYELISNAIFKDKPKLEKFIYNKNNDYFNKIEKALGIFQGIYTEKEYKENVGIECFPLNPISVYCLPKISEKVAQNERTLFTFLCKNESNTLANFIYKNEGKLQLLNLDSIYDYFEDLFKKETFNDLVHNTWIKADSALHKCADSKESEIVKSLAIVYIVNEFDRLMPTVETLVAALNYDEEEILQGLIALKEKNLIYTKKSNGYINFIPVSEINVKAKIDTIKNTRVRNINISQELSEIYNLGFILPKRYNDTFKMVRYFKNIYMTTEQLIAFQDIASLTEFYCADGVVVNLIYLDEVEKEQAISKIMRFNNGRIILNIPKRPFDKVDSIKELMAIKLLKEDKNFLSEETLADQLIEIYEDDLVEDIKSYVEEFFVIENRKSDFYINGAKVFIDRKAELNKIISNICSERFSRTPLINNELINKNNITTVISKARGKIVELILNSYNNEVSESLAGNGPEVTIYRATIKRFGLDNNTSTDDFRLSNVLNLIRTFIYQAETEKKCFNELYEELTGEDIGLRKGVIPIYLAFIIREFKDDSIIYFGSKGSKELNLSYDTLNNINNNPREYFIRIEKGTKEREEYLNLMIELFGKQIKDKELVSNKYEAIIKGMQSYIQSLSQFARTHKHGIDGVEIGKSITRLRIELLKFDINSREFLFKKLFKIMETEDYFHCFNKIKEVKIYLDEIVEKFKLYLIETTLQKINPNYKGKLTQGLKIWFDKLDDTKKEHLFDLTTNRFLEFVKQLDNHDESYVIGKLAEIITGLSIEDWQDGTVHQYIEDLDKIIANVEGLELDEIDSTDGMYKIKIDRDGEAVGKSFNVEEISEIGVTLLNEIEELFEEYGESIEANEKRNILMNLLKKYM
ncbi:hypothetical protein JK636_07345 [Clostridium sp. YIM B02515]|uniref:Uncharacterized protein n=1 Tax=Clostridium rhizosphaerae TaxID=2803861 RepID=A0ABS1TC62_9CLOT|nr:hypothetical protein [Clostridium rhizosphaerae]MBL4935573.1 hypothetical protein [Clostridium rhizosphaerae]